METKFKKFAKVAITTFRWLIFTLFQVILTGFNLFIIGSVIYYFIYVFGPTPRIESKCQSISIKKVDGFYLIQGEEYQKYKESTFPNCKIKFYDKELQFREGDIYDEERCITNEVEIQWTKGGFRVYYLKRSYPLETTNIQIDYPGWSINPEKKDMYAKDGFFYVDVDDRHGLINFIGLLVLLILLLLFRFWFLNLTRKVFYREFDTIYDFYVDTKSYLKTKIKKMKKKGD